MVVLIIIMINNMISIITMLQVKAAQEILWYRDKHLLNSSGRGGISITTDKVMVVMLMMTVMMMMFMMIFLDNWFQTGVGTVKTRGVGQQVPIILFT